MMIDVQTSSYLDAYRQAAAEHGASFPAMLWASPEGQAQRFSVFANTVGFSGRRIADLGAGRGDLALWLHNNHIDYASYIGIEAIDAFRQEATFLSAQHDIPHVRFELGDFVRSPQIFDRLVETDRVDTLLFSGSLNTLTPLQSEHTLQAAWTAVSARPGGTLAFNFLAGGELWCRPDTDLPRRDCGQWTAWALARTPFVTFCQGYLGTHDASVVMRVPGSPVSERKSSGAHS